VKERFEHSLKEALHDFSMKAEPGDWTRIERSLGLETRKRTPWVRIAATAAAVLLVGAGCFFLMQNTSPIRNGQGKTATVRESVDPAGNIPGSSMFDDPAVIAKAVLTRAVNHPDAGHTANRISDPTPVIPDTQPNDPTPNDRTAANRTEADTPPIQVRRSAAPSRPYAFVPDNRLLKTRRGGSGRNLSLALYAGGSMAGNRKVDFNLQRINAQGGLSLYTSESALSPSDLAAMSTPSNDQLVQFTLEENSGSYTAEVAEWNHDFPLTFGLMFRHRLTNRLGIESGVGYTLLTSRQQTSAITRRGQLHYLGLPVALVYTPLRVNNLEFYVRGGGQADFNIAGQLRTSYDTGTNNVVHLPAGGRIQWSVSARAGIMYNLSDRFGLYIEPGVNHYFTYPGQPESYWKEHPTAFNLQAGFRTSF
jgi:opacity protein-like surface antigen